MDDPRTVVKCKYSIGYDKDITIYVKEIIPRLFVEELYLELVTENETYPATWLDWNQGDMVAGCYENF